MGRLANATDEVVIVHIVIVDIAIVEIDDPGIVGVVLVGSRRPVIVRLGTK